MPKYWTLIHVENFQMYDPESDDSDDSPNVVTMGIYVNAYVEADTSEAAEYASIDLVRSSKLRDAKLNPPDDPPRMSVEEIRVLPEWPSDGSFPLSGFIFYDEANQEPKPDPPSS